MASIASRTSSRVRRAVPTYGAQSAHKKVERAIVAALWKYGIFTFMFILFLGTGWLVRLNVWLSLIWVVPAVLLLAVLVGLLFVDRAVPDSRRHFWLAFIAPAVVTVGVVVIVFGNFARSAWIAISGDWRFGQAGVPGWVFVVIALSICAFVIICVMVLRIVFGVWKLVPALIALAVLAVFAIATFTLPIGWILMALSVGTFVFSYLMILKFAFRVWRPVPALIALAVLAVIALILPVGWNLQLTFPG